MSLEMETVFRRRANNRGLVFHAVRALAAGVRLHLRRRATDRALAHLNQQELMDIGLIRTDRGYKELHRDRYGAGYWHD